MASLEVRSPVSSWAPSWEVSFSSVSCCSSSSVDEGNVTETRTDRPSPLHLAVVCSVASSELNERPTEHQTTRPRRACSVPNPPLQHPPLRWEVTVTWVVDHMGTRPKVLLLELEDSERQRVLAWPVETLGRDRAVWSCRESGMRIKMVTSGSRPAQRSMSCGCKSSFRVIPCPNTDPIVADTKRHFPMSST